MSNLSVKFFIFFLILNTSCASVQSEKDFPLIKQEYLKLNSRFRSLHCLKNTEKNYEELLKKYRGLGFYVPDIDGKADIMTIKNLLPEIEKKRMWIREQKAYVKSLKSWPKSDTVGEKMEMMIKDLLRIKKDYFLEKDPIKKNKRAQESLTSMKSLEREFSQITKQYPFLLSFGFPVDHLKNRKIFDDFKNQKEQSSVTVANYAYFYRRIMEDGAYDKDHTKPDIFLRSTLDTIWYEFDSKSSELKDDLRVDLTWVINRMRLEISKGREKILERLEEWDYRTQRHLEFYRNLIDPANDAHTQKIVSEHNQASIKLKKYTAEFQRDTYLFWRTKSDLMKALFAMDTILINEVGDVDGGDALERRDVAQIIYNRKTNSDYNHIDKEQDLYPLLKEKLSQSEIDQEEWLNVLFKKGEFSFTYAYIPGVIKIVCPDISKKARNLQSENVSLSLATLTNPQKDFTPLRYFSRASMLGRINMASIWENFEKYPERAGLFANGQEILNEKLKLGQYQFLYSFNDPKNEEYWVIQVGNKIYGVRFYENTPIFYFYRNPHDFTYFSPVIEEK